MVTKAIRPRQVAGYLPWERLPTWRGRDSALSCRGARPAQLRYPARPSKG